MFTKNNVMPYLVRLEVCLRMSRALSPPTSRLDVRLSHDLTVVSDVVEYIKASPRPKKQDVMKYLGGYLMDPDKGKMAAVLRTSINNGSYLAVKMEVPVAIEAAERFFSEVGAEKALAVTQILKDRGLKEVVLSHLNNNLVHGKLEL